MKCVRRERSVDLFCVFCRVTRSQRLVDMSCLEEHSFNMVAAVVLTSWRRFKNSKTFRCTDRACDPKLTKRSTCETTTKKAPVCSCWIIFASICESCRGLKMSQDTLTVPNLIHIFTWHFFHLCGEWRRFQAVVRHFDSAANAGNKGTEARMEMHLKPTGRAILSQACQPNNFHGVRQNTKYWSCCSQYPVLGPELTQVLTERWGCSSRFALRPHILSRPQPSCRNFNPKSGWFWAMKHPVQASSIWG